MLDVIPGPEQERLVQALAGSWTATERQLPPLSPEPTTRSGFSHNRPAMGGLYLITDYAQHSQDGHMTFEGHGIYGWDAAVQRYTMQWFDSHSPTGGGVVLGQWLDATLRFEKPGRARYEYEALNADTYLFRVLVCSEDQWHVAMEGTYLRVG